MARIIAKNEEPFQVPNHTFAIGPSSSGYTLNYSVDGENYTAYGEATDADTNKVVINAAIGLYFKLAGNSDEAVDITW